MVALEARRRARRSGSPVPAPAPLAGVGDSLRRDDVTHSLI